MEHGRITGMFTAALDEYGYTRDELDAARRAGKTAKDIAKEIIDHGYDDSSNDADE